MQMAQSSLPRPHVYSEIPGQGQLGSPRPISSPPWARGAVTSDQGLRKLFGIKKEKKTKKLKTSLSG